MAKKKVKVKAMLDIDFGIVDGQQVLRRADEIFEMEEGEQLDHLCLNSAVEVVNKRRQEKVNEKRQTKADANALKIPKKNHIEAEE